MDLIQYLLFELAWLIAYLAIPVFVFGSIITLGMRDLSVRDYIGGMIRVLNDWLR